MGTTDCISGCKHWLWTWFWTQCYSGEKPEQWWTLTIALGQDGSGDLQCSGFKQLITELPSWTQSLTHSIPHCTTLLCWNCHRKAPMWSTTGRGTEIFFLSQGIPFFLLSHLRSFWDNSHLRSSLFLKDFSPFLLLPSRPEGVPSCLLSHLRSFSSEMRSFSSEFFLIWDLSHLSSFSSETFFIQDLSHLRSSLFLKEFPPASFLINSLPLSSCQLPISSLHKFISGKPTTSGKCTFLVSSPPSSPSSPLPPCGNSEDEKIHIISSAAALFMC